MRSVIEDCGVQAATTVRACMSSARRPTVTTTRAASNTSTRFGTPLLILVAPPSRHILFHVS